MKNFTVVSYGYSASRWLAYSLSLHPKIFVAHGTYAIDSIYNGSDSIEREQEKSGERLDSLTRGRERLDIKSMTIDKLYSLYQSSFPGMQAYGNVHTYVPRELFYKEERESLDIQVFHLVRNPIAFLKSHTTGVLQSHNVPELNEHYENFYKLFLTRFPYILKKSWFDKGNPNQRAFIISCYTLFNLAQDIRRYGSLMKTIRMEDITTNPIALKSICEEITDCEYDQNSLKQWVEKGKINQHQTSHKQKINLSKDEKVILQSIISEELYAYLYTLNYELPELNHDHKKFD